MGHTERVFKSQVGRKVYEFTEHRRDRKPTPEEKAVLLAQMKAAYEINFAKAVETWKAEQSAKQEQPSDIKTNIVLFNRSRKNNGDSAAS